MISFAAARKIVLEQTAVLPDERRMLLGTLGYVLAEEARASFSIPPADNSAVDGFAVRVKDVSEASSDNPISLRILEDIPAGTVPTGRVGPDEASRIMTGARIPEGADGVVMVEDTESEGDRVVVKRVVAVGENIRRAGEDVRKGDQVLSTGTVIRPQEMGMAASLGIVEVGVIRKPRVAVLSTGDELAAPGSGLRPGQIHDSNRFSLVGQVLAAGGIPLDLGICPDDSKLLLDLLGQGLADADVVLTSGGVSVGAHDLLRDLFAQVSTVHFWRVAMKPGKPLLFGTREGKLVFGLPGNPVSVMVVFEQLIRPALLKMMGRGDLFRPLVLATLTTDLESEAGRREFVRARIERSGGEYVARPTGPQGSGILRSMVLANGFVVVPEEIEHLDKGAQVAAELWV